jgi:uncharacterized protein YsxB (DUF464 family)
MIRICAEVDDAGLLVSCDVRGHAASGPPGKDTVCAAISVLLRTAFRTLAKREGIRLGGGAPERGHFHIETVFDPGNDPARLFLAGAGAFLLEGLESVSGENPEFCGMTIRKVNRRN